ncbi:MAG: D-aminoacyl-tRNA deacylase [Actinomycetota bacterium]|nr:D-aminoacyl-tRNA deacylase [Actinomycetota bacterium]MDH5223634.1 D-aminoacyl-tRNA deacylase [Actinomycetota bacterium]
MRVVLQRVAGASVTVDGDTVARIGRGFLLLVGVGHADGADEAERLAEKISTVRVFADADGKMNLALADVAGEVLVISQFTLFANLTKGRRPSWTDAAEPAIAAGLVDALADGLERRGLPVSRGVFGADMQVSLTNDGPVTLVLDSASL